MKDFNGLTKELDTTYFPQVKYYHDNKHTQKIHYACELFNNGCLTLDKLIDRLVKETKDSAENIKKLILKYYTHENK
jgi:hypothetical protein